jgi:hypothetical protein
MARRKSSHRGHRAKRSRRTKHTRRRHTRHVRRTRRGGDGSIGTPYSAYRMMPLNPNQTLDGQNFSRANQFGGGGGITRSRTGGSTCTGGTLQPSGNNINQSCPNGQMATTLVTGGRA